MSGKKFYITTPIYYPSGNWHIGTSYTTVVCDALARFKRMEGYDVFYLTGTDEHGQKIETAAKAQNIDVMSYLDAKIDALKKLWDILGISYDKFIRTTDDYHVKAVQRIFEKLYEKGDIYKSTYEGWYCTPCETFLTNSQLKDGKCPDCGREVVKMEEESYFFRMTKYRDRLIDLIENNPEFLEPKPRQNEMLNNFLRPGLQDLCISRTTLKWGIPVPFDEKHVVYVWLDALSNYITALGYAGEDDSLFNRYWPADIHMIGKEIVRFHSLIWPAMLMALDLPLPKKIYAHGWLLFNNEKISKSKSGGSSNITDPVELSRRYSVDAVRYFLLREVPFGNDGAFTNAAFLNRRNADLCNSLGNLLSRTTAMVEQYFGGILPAPNVTGEPDNELIDLANSVFASVKANMDALMVPEALGDIFKLINRANKYIDETMPWILAKTPEGVSRLETVLYNLIETLRLSATLLTPFLIDTPKAIFDCLSIEKPALFDGAVNFGVMKAGTKIIKSGKLFERIDVEKELLAIEKEHEQKIAAAEKPAAEKEEVKGNPLININQFADVELRVATVISAKPVQRSEKLLELSVDLGYETRTVASGIAKYYKPEELIGKQIVLVANLQPAKLCGIESRGMILCAEDNGKVVLVSPEILLKNGSKVS